MARAIPRSARSQWQTLLPAALCALLILGVVTRDSIDRSGPATPISTQSLAMEAVGERLFAAGQIGEAAGYFESALAADPRNIRAYNRLGAIALRQELPGRAVRYFRAALALDPKDRTALSGQGQALIARGAVERARRNLARLQALCGGPCPEVAMLTRSLSAAGARTALNAQEIVPRPVVEPLTSSN